MVIHAPSLPSHRLRELRLPRLALDERKSAIARRWDSPLRLFLFVAVAGSLVLLVSGAVLVLVLTWSLLWVVLLIPCAAAWVGMLNEVGVLGFAPAVGEPSPAVEVEVEIAAPAPPAASAARSSSTAAGTRRKAPAAGPRKPRSSQA